MEDLLIELLQVSMGTRDMLSRAPTSQEWKQLLIQAEYQAIVGILVNGLDNLPVIQRPPKSLLLQWIGKTQIIIQKNKLMNKAVVDLCKEMCLFGNQFLVVKGQTLAALYTNKELRQSGDIDYLVHPKDWNESYIRLVNSCPVKEDNAEKHIEWHKGDVLFEMHHSLASFAYGKHQRYWERVVEKEIWNVPWAVEIDGYAVPTLAPVYNALYIFVHIFEHFIKEGIGLRQLVDWRVLMGGIDWVDEEIVLLEHHLNGIGLRKAFIGFGAILVDYLGLPEERFPFCISEKDHENASPLIKNIIEMGNFGHNKGALRGFKHIGRICGQALKFGHYAPIESWMRIPHMFRWWGIKIGRTICRSRTININ